MSGRSLLSQRLQECERQAREGDARPADCCAGARAAPCGATLKRCGPAGLHGGPQGVQS